MKLRTPILATALLCAYQPVSANMDIAFVESAPKDWFSLTNSSECVLEKINMTVDLSSTAGKLIFDTTSAGEGVEVFQPFETREGNVRLTSAETVLDGENRLSVFVDTLAPGQSISFTIDVDDTLPKSELGNIRVSDSEMVGGMVSLQVGEQPDVTGTFNSQALISLPSPDCRIPSDIWMTVTLVANQPIPIPKSRFIKAVRVGSGFDVADNYIVQHATAGDLVITADIPLAAELVEKDCAVINPRGERYTADNIRERLNMRDFMDDLRGSGVDTGGPPALNQTDRRNFANQLDRLLIKLTAGKRQ